MLSQAIDSSSSSGTIQVIVWSGILVVLLIGGFVVVSRVRQKLKADEPAALGSAGFTLSDLRQLHRTGQISNEEFEKAKASIVEAARRASQREAAGASGHPARPASLRALDEIKLPEPRPPEDPPAPT